MNENKLLIYHCTYMQSFFLKIATDGRLLTKYYKTIYKYVYMCVCVYVRVYIHTGKVELSNICVFVDGQIYIDRQKDRQTDR
jgi:hypothetical protein